MNKDPQTYEIIGAAMEVHRHLGHGQGLPLNFGALSLEYKRLVFNLRESAQSADKLKETNLTGA